MTEVERLEYVISADNSKAVTAFQETGKAYEQMDSKLSSSSSSQFGTNISSGANTAKGAIGTLSGAVDTLGTKLKNISAGQAFSAIESGASKAARTMQGIGIAATAVGVPVGLLAKSSLSAFAELESQIQRDVSLIGGGKAEFQELLNLSKELGETTPFNTTEIARGVESLAAAGYSMEQIKAAMGTVTEMSIAAGEPLESMSDILVNVLSQFGGAATDAEHFADVLAVGANESTASITDMGEALKYAGNMAPITQKSVEEFSAALTVMANNGIKGTMAGTGLVDILGDLAKPALPAQMALKELGLTKEDIDPATNSLEELLTTLNRVGLADPANLNKLYTIFGKQGAPKISSLISDEGLAKYKEIVDKMVNESTNANKRMADAQRDTLDYALQQISESFQKVQLSIGEGLKPLALDLNNWLQKNGDTLTTFAENAVKGLTPFVNKVLELGKAFMEWFNSLPSDMQGKVAGLTGLGAAMAAIGGPLLLLGSLPVAAIGNIAGVFKSLFEIRGASAIGAGVSTLVTSLKELSGVTAIRDISQYLLPIGPTAAGAAGEVGLLTSALATLGGPIGAGAIVAVAAGLAAYTTNFGDFRDNINAIISDLGSAASNIASGDFEAAGRDCAEAFSKGLEAAWDVSVATIGSLPEIGRAISEMKSGFDKAAYEMSKGFTDQLTSTISGMVIGLPHLLFTEEGKKELIDSIKSAVASIDLSAEGTAAMRSFASGFAGLDMILNPFVQGAVASMHGSFNDFIKGLPDLPGLEQYKQYIKDTEADAEELKRKYGLNTPDAVKLDYSNYNYGHNSSSGGTVQIDSVGVASAVTQGVTNGSGAIADAVKESGTTGFDEFKAEKNKGLSDREKYTDESLHKLYDTNSNLITKYDALAASKAEEAEATKSGTAAKKKLTTIEAALADNAIGLNDSFETADGTFKKVIENGAYVAQEQGAAAELLRYNQAEIEKQSASDKAAQEKLTDAKKSYAEQIERAKLDYSQAIRSADTSDAVKSAEESYQFKIEDIQLKAQQTGVDISDLNTTLDKTGSTVDILNTKYTTFNQDLLQQLRELEQEKAKKISTAAEKGKIADTDSLDKRIKKLQDEISNNEAELKKSTASQRENVDIVKNSIQTQGDANKAVIEFGPAVDIGKESITTFSDSVGKIDLEGQFRQLFSDIDLREILNSGLNYQADMAVGRKASDADRTAVKEGYEDRFMATVASEVPKAADWAKTIGEPIESALAENGTVWAAVTKSYLENVRGVTGIPSALGWTQNDYMKGYLSGDDYAAISAMLKNIRPVVEGVYSGNVDVTGSGGYSDSMGKWWGTTFEAIQKADDATRDYSTSLSALSSAQYASDSRAVALTQAYNQAQDATASLDRYLADSSVSASEAADMQSQLSGINSLLAQSGVDATGGLTNLPGALQAVASAVQSTMAAINAAIGAAQNAVNKTQAAQPVSETPSRAPQVMKDAPVITQNINLQNSRFTRDYDPQKVIKDAFGAIGARG